MGRPSFPIEKRAARSPGGLSWALLLNSVITTPHRCRSAPQEGIVFVKRGVPPRPGSRKLRQVSISRAKRLIAIAAELRALLRAQKIGGCLVLAALNCGCTAPPRRRSMAHACLYAFLTGKDPTRKEDL